LKKGSLIVEGEFNQMARVGTSMTLEEGQANVDITVKKLEDYRATENREDRKNLQSHQKNRQTSFGCMTRR
jgi:hypothetical protein